MNITPNTPLEHLPQFLTPNEFRILTRIGRSTIYDAIRRGEVPSVRFGRAVRIPREALRRYLEVGGSARGQSHDEQA
jgi:excisionase family DNA binding protein